tara:strand:- start:634 stop:1251 length:618 start_codon:yes stop_codon:yes gene_type:complete
MGIYASGAKSHAICDRCGFKYSFLSLREEWTGHKVCTDCWEPKHPQLEPRSAVDATLLYKARPGEHAREDASPRIFRGVTIYSSLGLQSQISKATPSGVAITSAIGTSIGTATLNESGVAITSALGSIKTGAGVAGVAITSALGSETLSISANVASTGVTTTVALGNEVPMAMDLPAGVAGTFAVGSVTVNCWGAGAWDTGTWGN